MQIAYPFRTDTRSRTASTDQATHIRDLIEQVLFTAQGERVNRPRFGSGLLQLVFERNSNELATATQFLAQASLQQWLGDLIQVQSLDVAADDATLRITVRYIIRSNQQREVAQFTRTV